MNVRPMVTLPLNVAPSLSAVGVDSLRVRRQSHIRLTATEYNKAADLILAAARQEAHRVG